MPNVWACMCVCVSASILSLWSLTCSSHFQLDLWELSGDGDSEPSTACHLFQFTYVHLHGVIMYIAWGILFPLGALLGRYYRWTWPIWFILHVSIQVNINWVPYKQPLTLLPYTWKISLHSSSRFCVMTYMTQYCNIVKELYIFTDMLFHYNGHLDRLWWFIKDNSDLK